MTLREVDHPWQSRPAEFYKGYWDPILGWVPSTWIQNGVGKHVKKRHYHFIWPKDGKNGNKWGRLKDCLTGRGPDVHITIGAKKHDYMSHRPRRSIWGLHDDLDESGPDCSIPSPFKSANKIREYSNNCYDFQTRKFRRPYQGMWTDAHWQSKPDDHPWPKAIRNNWGVWFQDPRYVPLHMHIPVFGQAFSSEVGHDFDP